jgi:LysR family transcriptional regulator, glycine cleavage system transcriptional activator
MKSISRLPLNSLRVFDAVAQFGSMRRASEALSVQPSAVSMQIKNLNQYIGVAVFEARGRHLELTATGAALLPIVRSALAQIEEKIRSLKLDSTKRPFKLSVLTSFLHCWLLHRLPDFEARHPDFQLQILTGRELVELTGAAADAAVRLGGGKWAGLSSVKLMNDRLIPVAAPKLAKKFGRFAPGQIPANAKLLHSSVDPWSIWVGKPIQGLHQPVEIDDTFALLNAAEDGQGVALVRESLCERAFSTGRLVSLGNPIGYRYAYYFVQARQAPAHPGAQLFLLWLKRQIAECKDPPLRSG